MLRAISRASTSISAKMKWMEWQIDEKFYERIRRACRRKQNRLPIPELWEDLAQDITLKYMENKESRQTVDQAHIDACRETFGDSRNPTPGVEKFSAELPRDVPTITHERVEARLSVEALLSKTDRWTVMLLTRWVRDDMDYARKSSVLKALRTVRRKEVGPV